mgnify:CR=1 FL=1
MEKKNKKDVSTLNEVVGIMLNAFQSNQEYMDKKFETIDKKFETKLLAEHFDTPSQKTFEEPKKPLLSEKIPGKKVFSIENLKTKISEKEDTKNLEAQKLAPREGETSSTVNSSSVEGMLNSEEIFSVIC